MLPSPEGQAIRLKTNHVVEEGVPAHPLADNIHLETLKGLEAVTL